jgi:hypothetical protein
LGVALIAAAFVLSFHAKTASAQQLSAEAKAERCQSLREKFDKLVVDGQLYKKRLTQAHLELRTIQHPTSEDIRFNLNAARLEYRRASAELKRIIAERGNDMSAEALEIEKEARSRVQELNKQIDFWTALSHKAILGDVALGNVAYKTDFYRRSVENLNNVIGELNTQRSENSREIGLSRESLSRLDCSGTGTATVAENRSGAGIQPTTLTFRVNDETVVGPLGRTVQGATRLELGKPLNVDAELDSPLPEGWVFTVYRTGVQDPRGGWLVICQGRVGDKSCIPPEGSPGLKGLNVIADEPVTAQVAGTRGLVLAVEIAVSWHK